MRSHIHSIALALLGAGVLAACRHGAGSSADAPPPWVLTAPVEVSSSRVWTLTGTLHARHEIPLSFRIAGEIVSRQRDAGERVAAGERLFELDPRDVLQQRVSAEANVASARAAAVNAERERQRLADMVKRRLTSQQDYDRAATAARAAAESLTGAEAALRQAVNAVGYASLAAPASGILLEVTGQKGQVVGAGQAVATLAADGPREVEVDVPEDRSRDLPRTATAYPLGQGRPLAVSLREVAGAADAGTRTWRARYRLVDEVPDLALGTTFTLRFSDAGTAADGVQRVPIAAVLERGQGATVWRLDGDRVQPEPVALLGIAGEYAEISSALEPGTRVVALGVNRLQPGQRVRVRQP